MRGYGLRKYLQHGLDKNKSELSAMKKGVYRRKRNESMKQQRLDVHALESRGVLRAVEQKSRSSGVVKMWYVLQR